jgi:hypothetical protein
LIFCGNRWIIQYAAILGIAIVFTLFVIIKTSRRPIKKITMNDVEKTSEQLLEELVLLRERNEWLERKLAGMQGLVEGILEHVPEGILSATAPDDGAQLHRLSVMHPQLRCPAVQAGVTTFREAL